MAFDPHEQMVLISVMESATSKSLALPGNMWVRKSVLSPKHSTGMPTVSTISRSWSI